jgi:VanZ family protein
LNREMIKPGPFAPNCRETDEKRMAVAGGAKDVCREPIRSSGLSHLFFHSGPALAYAALIFFLSSLSRFPEAVPTFFGFDMIAHFFEYVILGCLLYRWFSSTDRYRKRRSALLMTILIGTIYAVSDEWHQSFVPGRDASPWDVLFDAAGNGTGSAICPFIMKAIRSGRGRPEKGERF